jgi:hypothetical protein
MVTERMIELGKPLCITNFYIDKPCFIIILGVLILCGLSYLSVYLNYFE